MGSWGEIMSGVDQRAGGPVDRVAKTASASAGGTPTKGSPDEAFLNLLANR